MPKPLLYCVGGLIKATHLDNQRVDPKFYGPDCRVIPVADYTDGEVGDPEPTPTPEILKNYAANKRWLTEVGGTVINNLDVATDESGRMKINMLYLLSQADQQLVSDWKMPDGSFVELGKAEIETLQTGVSGFIEQCFTAEEQARTGIGNGSITTYDQVDALFDPLPPRKVARKK